MDFAAGAAGVAGPGAGVRFVAGCVSRGDRHRHERNRHRRRGYKWVREDRYVARPADKLRARRCSVGGDGDQRASFIATGSSVVHGQSRYRSGE